MPRVRGKSTREETNITSFVASTVEFTSNVTVSTDLSDVKTKHVLILAQSKDAVTELSLPKGLWCAALKSGLDEASSGTIYSVDAEACRVHIGLIPTRASRHNCPYRPDVMVSLVAAAIEAVNKAAALTVVSLLPPDAALSVTKAVARGSGQSFSAKNGMAEMSYFNKGNPVRLILNKLPGSITAGSLGHIATGVQLAMRIIDAPPCLLDTTTFAEIAEAYAGKLGFQFSEIRGEALREKGYGGIHGVGKAAEYPPALVTLSYQPKGGAGITPKDKIALVGKGIVYDTGGLSLKAGSNMCSMKFDMGGAGGLFASFITLVRLGVQRPVDCVLCLADNAIGPLSQRNDDIVRMKSGVTVEINNTDAEGRLVLGDGVFHAAKECGAPPSLILDMATLTGAQGIATGTKHAAIFTDSAEWEGRVEEAGRKSGDLAMRLVFAPEFHMPEFSSVVADCRNSVRSRSNAQSSCAGAFIHNNLPSDFAGDFVHIDMASPAVAKERATGYGVALISQLFGDLE